VVTSSGDRGHAASERGELFGLTETGEVADRIDGGHVNRLFAAPVGTTSLYRTHVRLSNVLVGALSGGRCGCRGRLL
jgi:hypothetical protein